jgi:ketosteroid isomerase-like protein
MVTQHGTHAHAAMNPTVRKLADELQPLLDTLASCMDRGDAPAAAALFVEDGNLISPFGMIGTGAAGVLRVLAADMESILTGAHSQFTIDSVRPLGELVFADVTHEITGIRAGPQRALEVHGVLLARKQGGGWKLVEARPYFFMTPQTTH